MLQIPSPAVKHYTKSSDRHNIDPQFASDWIEASVLFFEEVCFPDLVDSLVEEGYYDDQSLAWEGLSDVKRCLEGRRRLMNGNDLLVMEANKIRLNTGKTWRDYPAYSFCLMLSLTHLYPEWYRKYSPDYIDQGALFEEVTAASLKSLFPCWEVQITGFSSGNPVNLPDVISELSSKLNEVSDDPSKWFVSPGKMKEMGLDVVLYRPFSDNRGGLPLFMVQCATGKNWNSKLATPDPDKWKFVIRFQADPNRAFSMPFSISDDELKEAQTTNRGLILDRYRLINVPCPDETWVPDSLKKKLIDWLDSRIPHLEELSEVPE
jgi:hypothetical protein